MKTSICNVVAVFFVGTSLTSFGSASSYESLYNSVGVGKNADSPGWFNSAVGYSSLNAATGTHSSVAVGYRAMSGARNCHGCIAIGSSQLEGAIGKTNVTSIGSHFYASRDDDEIIIQSSEGIPALAPIHYKNGRMYLHGKRGITLNSNGSTNGIDIVSTNGVAINGISFKSVDEGIVVYFGNHRLGLLQYAETTPITISFNTDYADDVSSVSIPWGTGVTCPTNIVKYIQNAGGYNDGAFTLEGWYRDSSKTLRYNNGDPLYSSRTLYAKWNDNRVITVSGNSGITKHTLAEMTEFSVTLGSNTKIGYDHSQFYRVGLEVVVYNKYNPTTYTTNNVALASISWPTLYIDNNISTLVVDDRTAPWYGRVVSTGLEGKKVVSDWFDINVTID